ncbi:MAG TPA: tetratricopeptide repeat protein [Aridibacter sp.]|nr:tetratricopeptide repeat protein [Aridibacter sp.]
MSTDRTEKSYVFEDFRLDTARKLLFRLPEEKKVRLTNKAFEVLLTLVENSGELVTKDELMERVWADSFVEESNLTQTISVLRRKLGEDPNQHRFIVTEPGKGYRFVARVAETGGNENEALTEPQVRNEDQNDKGAAGRISNKLKVFLAGLALFLLAVVIAGALYFGKTSQPSSTSEVRSIAVLPFKNIESGAEDKLLGIGMADAVITKLSRTKSIVVRQTDTVIRYADATPEAIKVGRDINVDAVLEGNIQKAERRIRVSVRLFRVNDGALLWAERFDEWETNIFALQDSIAEKVARSLSLELDPEDRESLRRRYTDNIEAYQLYNKGRYFWNNRNSEDLTKSIAFYEQAIALDPEYALAYAGLAETFVVLHTYSPYQTQDAFPKAKQAAEKALSLDNNLAEAYTALAMYKEQHEYDWKGAEVKFRQAISANPSYATARQWYGEFLAFLGRTEEAVAEVEKAVELDPLSLSTNTARAFPHLAARQYDEAIAKLKPALELDKNFPLALYYLGRSYDGKALYERSVPEYRKAIESSGRSTYFISALIYALARNGKRTEAERAFAEILEIAGERPVSRYVLARCYAALGKNEKALDELEKAYEERDSLMIVMGIEQIFDDIRDETRFQELVRKLDLDQVSSSVN